MINFIWDHCRKSFGLCLLALTISACVASPGGGNSSSQQSSQQSSKYSSPPSDLTNSLIITEIGSTYYYNVSAWIEIYNRWTNQVNLADFQLRTTATLLSSGASAGIQTFSLPALTIQPGAYAIIRGFVYPEQQNGGNVVYISNGLNVPFWFGSGFAELLQSGATVDFVRFGSDTTAPESPNQWDSGDAPSLPALSNTYGMSIARDGSNHDSNSYSDWYSRAFATPGGPNDVTTALCSDGDGIPDSCKVTNSTFAGLPLYNWGARPGHKDIFIHIDYMDSTDPGVTPRKEALDKVKAVFLSHGYYVHFDAGDLYSSTVSEANDNLDGRSHKVPFFQAVALGYVPGMANVFLYKNSYMPQAKKQIFHYMLMAYSQNSNGSAGSSGIANLPGSSFIITLGNDGLTTTPAYNLNVLINFQAATIMHEFGHNLGLYHGGDEDLNYKPNYYSTMNYEYQLSGLPTAGTAREGDRYYYYQKYIVGNTSFSNFITNSYLGLYNGPTNTNFIMDYSSGSGAVIDENSINEAGGIGQPGSAWVDFDGNGLTNSGYALNLNSTYDSINGTFHDYNDWANIQLFFSRGNNNEINGGASIPGDLKIWENKVDDESQPYIVETLMIPVIK